MWPSSARRSIRSAQSSLVALRLLRYHGSVVFSCCFVHMSTPLHDGRACDIAQMLRTRCLFHCIYRQRARSVTDCLSSSDLTRMLPYSASEIFINKCFKLSKFVVASIFVLLTGTISYHVILYIPCFLVITYRGYQNLKFRIVGTTGTHYIVHTGTLILCIALHCINGYYRGYQN